METSNLHYMISLDSLPVEYGVVYDKQGKGIKFKYWMN